MPLPESEIKCALSEAYLSAITAVAGYPCTIEPRRTDFIGVDASIKVIEDFGPKAKLSNFTVSIQLKSTSTALVWSKDNTYSYDVDIGIYNKYRSIRSGDLMLLLLLVLPPRHNATRWLSCTECQLSIKGCAYWVSLFGAQDKPNNSSTVAIKINKRDRISVSALKKMMKDFSVTEQPVKYGH